MRVFLNWMNIWNGSEHLVFSYQSNLDMIVNSCQPSLWWKDVDSSCCQFNKEEKNLFKIQFYCISKKYFFHKGQNMRNLSFKSSSSSSSSSCMQSLSEYPDLDEVQFEGKSSTEVIPGSVAISDPALSVLNHVGVLGASHLQLTLLLALWATLLQVSPLDWQKASTPPLWMSGELVYVC